MVNKRRGRPPGKSDSRERIITAAQESFIAVGYTGSTLRGIAAEAGVDHTLVNYYFGTKENLFSEAMLGGFSPSRVFQAVRAAPGISLANLPVALSNALITFCETPQFQRDVVPTLRLAFTDEDTRALVTGYIEREIFGEAEKLLLVLKSRQPRCPKTNAREVVVGLSTSLLGAMVARYILRVHPHSDMTAREFQAVLQRLLKGALG